MAAPRPILLDTQLLVWWAVQPERVPGALRTVLFEDSQVLLFSVASLWEVAIKTSLGRPDFQLDGWALRQGLRLEGFGELPIAAEHALSVRELPWIHRDPFDRLLIAQALRDQLQLMTCDSTMIRYTKELPELQVICA
jgi:PIN domain nuclease of toxin-antitoxin system